MVLQQLIVCLVFIGVPAAVRSQQLEDKHDVYHVENPYSGSRYTAIGDACLNDFKEAGICRPKCLPYEDHDGYGGICEYGSSCCVSKCGECYGEDGTRGVCRPVCYNHESKSKHQHCGKDYCCVDDTGCKVKDVSGEGSCRYSCSPKRHATYKSSDCYGKKQCCIRNKGMKS